MFFLAGCQKYMPEKNFDEFLIKRYVRHFYTGVIITLLPILR